jgi:thiamine pyrophosphate-dependent acetolactate synthase large subunit-like protein
MTSHAIKGSDIFIRVLENEGVEYIFGVPGEENLDMLESLCVPKTSSVSAQ